MSICQLHSVLIPSFHPQPPGSPACFPQVPAGPPLQGSCVSCAKSMCFDCKQPWIQHHFCKKVNTTPSSPSRLEVGANHTQSPLHMVGVWSVSMALASRLLTSLPDVKGEWEPPCLPPRVESSLAQASEASQSASFPSSPPLRAPRLS